MAALMIALRAHIVLALKPLDPNRGITDPEGIFPGRLIGRILRISCGRDHALGPEGAGKFDLVGNPKGFLQPPIEKS